MTTVLRVAHLSDLHLGPLPRVRVHELLSKRMLGYASWIQKRRKRHRSEALDLIAADIKEQAIDHTVITGDLVNISLPDEFLAAAAWLEAFGPPSDVTIVPGNHDAYVAGAAGRWASWARYMGGDTDPADPVLPFVRRIGPASIIGLSTAVPSPAGYASGRLGRAQLEALERLLTSLADEDGPRIVLLHHPPVEGWSSRRKSLQDAAAFRAILARHGADLVLCGHEHRLLIGALEGPDGDVPVFCAPSASLTARPDRPGGGYMVYAIELSPGCCRIAAEHRAPRIDGHGLEGGVKAAFERSVGTRRRLMRLA
jgi:3',5'-cyclic AMP phosphodiesterase CpdA